jgi:hypothetical protein
MGDRGGELPHRRDAVGVRQLGVERLPVGADAGIADAAVFCE